MSRTLFIITFCMTTIFFPSCRAENVLVVIELDDGGDHYRVRIENHNRQAVEFNEGAFFVPVDGGSPTGSRILVRDRNDRPIYSGAGEGRGYSSNDMVSRIFQKRKPEWHSVAASGAHISGWFSLQELMQGLESVAEEPNRRKWKDYNLLFELEIKGEKAAKTVMSGWIPFRAK